MLISYMIRFLCTIMWENKYAISLKTNYYCDLLSVASIL